MGAAGQRSEAELAARHVDDTEPEQRVTAAEWLDAHREAVEEDDRHREITETDLHDPALEDDRADEAAQRTDELVERDDADDSRSAQSPTIPGRDIREITVDEPAPIGEDVVRVPPAEEVADHLDDADRALAEIRAREIVDQQEESTHRAAELNRWHVQDQAITREAEQGMADEYDDADVL